MEETSTLSSSKHAKERIRDGFGQTAERAGSEGTLGSLQQVKVRDFPGFFLV